MSNSKTVAGKEVLMITVDYAPGAADPIHRHDAHAFVYGVAPVLESGYFRAKMAQENLIKASPLPYTILHSTQFFEFMGRIAPSSADGQTVRVSPALAQPIVSDEVAAALADIAVRAPANGMLEVAGPERARLDEFVQRTLIANQDVREVVTDAQARYFGAELNDQSLVPGDEALIGATRFEDWLRSSTAQRPADKTTAAKSPASAPR